MTVEQEKTDHYTNEGYDASMTQGPAVPRVGESQTVRIVENTTGDNSKHRFTPKSRRNIKILSVGHIILGALVFISQTVVTIWAVHIYDCWINSLLWFLPEPIPEEGAGFWSGIMFIVAGIISLKVSQENVDKRWITAAYILNLFCALLVFVLLTLAILSIYEIERTFCIHHNALAVTFSVIMILSGVVELVICLWALILACDARYGCCAEDREQHYDVMYNEDSRPSTPRTITPRAWKPENSSNDTPPPYPGTV